MSFTTEIKQEIAFNELKDCCAKAQLSALIQLCSSLTISNQRFVLIIKTENSSTAKRILKLVKYLYNAEVELSVIQKLNLKKNKIYELRVVTLAKNILEDLMIYKDGFNEHPPMTLFKKECCIRAYIAGAFLSIGSCNSPSKSSYHLELATNSDKYAQFLNKLLIKYDLNSKIVIRRNKWVVYIKIADKISDFLRCVGAHESLLKFENIRIERDFMNSFTRLDNCELANEIKSISAANKQLEDINIIENKININHLDPKIKVIIELRKKFPEYSLNELCIEFEKETLTAITKSGIRHRFNKIHDIANKYR